MNQTKTLADSTITISLATGLLSLLGVVNQMVIGYLFGTSAKMDAYLIAMAAPSILSGVFGGSLGFLLIPILAQSRMIEGEEAFLALRNRLLSAIIFVTVALVALALAANRALIAFLTAGADEEKSRLVLTLSYIAWMYAGCCFLSSYFTALHHCDKKYSLPTLSLLGIPICAICSGLAFARYIGIHSIMMGSLTGSVAQLLWLYCWVSHRGRLRFVWDMSDSRMRKLLSSVLPLLLSLAPFSALPLIDALWSRYMPDGGLSFLGYSSRIVVPLTGLCALGISVVQFPLFAENVAQRDYVMLRAGLNRSLRLVFF